MEPPPFPPQLLRVVLRGGEIEDPVRVDAAVYDALLRSSDLLASLVCDTRTRLRRWNKPYVDGTLEALSRLRVRFVCPSSGAGGAAEDTDTREMDCRRLAWRALLELCPPIRVGILLTTVDQDHLRPLELTYMDLCYGERLARPCGACAAVTPAMLIRERKSETLSENPDATQNPSWPKEQSRTVASDMVAYDPSSSRWAASSDMVAWDKVAYDPSSSLWAPALGAADGLIPEDVRRAGADAGVRVELDVVEPPECPRVRVVLQLRPAAASDGQGQRVRVQLEVPWRIALRIRVDEERVRDGAAHLARLRARLLCAMHAALAQLIERTWTWRPITWLRGDGKQQPMWLAGQQSPHSASGALVPAMDELLRLRLDPCLLDECGKGPGAGGPALSACWRANVHVLYATLALSIKVHADWSYPDYDPAAVLEPEGEVPPSDKKGEACLERRAMLRESLADVLACRTSVSLALVCAYACCAATGAQPRGGALAPVAAALSDADTRALLRLVCSCP